MICTHRDRSTIPCRAPESDASRRFPAHLVLILVVGAGIAGAHWLTASVRWSSPMTPGTALHDHVRLMAAETIARWAAGAAYVALLAGCFRAALRAGMVTGSARLPIAAVALATGTALLLVLLATQAPFNLADVACILTGACSGVWLASSAARGLRNLLRDISLYAAGLLVVLCAFAALLTESTPRVSAVADMTDADRVRLRDLLDRAADDEAQPALLRLSEVDVNLLLNRWLSSAGAGVRATVELSPGTARVAAALPVRMPWLGQRFLNLQADVRPRVLARGRGLEIADLHVGPVPAPRILGASMAGAIDATLGLQGPAGDVLTSADDVQVREGALEAIGWFDRWLPSMMSAVSGRPPADPQFVASVRGYMEHFVPVAAELPAGDAQFVGLLQSAFSRAEQRAAQTSAAAENRAALVALGVLAGDPRLGRLLARPGDPPLPRLKLKEARDTTLRERYDWARHFLASAALSLLSSESISRTTGLLKEELDAGTGGTGFSFADWMADQAGVLFAATATRDESATRIQRNVAANLEVADLFPTTAGLPEGLRHSDRDGAYGGLSGEQFEATATDIRRRLEQCPLLQ